MKIETCIFFITQVLIAVKGAGNGSQSHEFCSGFVAAPATKKTGIIAQEQCIIYISGIKLGFKIFQFLPGRLSGLVLSIIFGLTGFGFGFSFHPILDAFNELCLRIKRAADCNRNEKNFHLVDFNFRLDR